MKICYPMELTDAPVHVPAFWQTAAGLGGPWAEEQMLCAALTPSRGDGHMRKPARNGPARAVDDSLNPKYPKALFSTAREWDLSLKRKRRVIFTFKYLSSWYNHALNSSIELTEDLKRTQGKACYKFQIISKTPKFHLLTWGHHLHLNIVPM